MSLVGHRATEMLRVSCRLELLGGKSTEPIADEGQELSLEVFLRNRVPMKQTRSGECWPGPSLSLGSDNAAGSSGGLYLYGLETPVLARCCAETLSGPASEADRAGPTGSGLGVCRVLDQVCREKETRG